VIESFFQEVAGDLAPFLVYGSGDFHHLSALWLRQLDSLTTLISFDNHPDWDMRPPRWGCGGWINRALELPQIETVSVWGCGNFECWWPRRIFGNNLAERRGRLEVHPWADERKASDQQRRGAILRQNWRENFARFVDQLGGKQVYVTIDLDCLREEEAITNWESGRFLLHDLVWALQLLARGTNIVAGDICGAWSPPRYARRKQRFAAEMDHPELPPRDPLVVRHRNRAALEHLLPRLTYRNQNDSDADDDRSNR
jgi:arginase family enzyme